MGLIGHGLSYLVPYAIVLSVLIFVHELGHYLVARWNRVRVEIFSIGFGPEAFGWNDKSGTRWRVSWLPLGGYVKMFGDADPSSRPSEAVHQMSAEERAVSHFFQPVGARAAIAVAGPAANFLFSIVVFAALFATVGEPFTPPDIGEIAKGSAAAAAGLKAGDVFVSVDGSAIERFEDIQQIIRLNTGTPVQIVVRRNSALIPVVATPRVTESMDRFGNSQRFAVLGVARAGVVFVRRGPVLAVVGAVREIGAITQSTFRGLGQIIAGTRPPDELGGPVRILKYSGEVAQDGPLALLGLMAMLSVNLGLVNLFPIPVLDGGHLLFYAAEALRGRPLGQRAQEIGFGLGLAVVLTLMIFVTWNDLAQDHVFKYLKDLVT